MLFRIALERRALSAVCSLLVMGVVACSSDSSSLESDGGDPLGVTQGSGGATASPGDGAAEQEVEESFVAPVVVGKYLWSANPETNKVARIHASSLEIDVIEAGHAPTYLAALPSGSTRGGALVLNRKSHDASIFLLDDEEKVRSETRVTVQEGASAWAVGRQGKFAVAWSRADDALLNAGDGYQDLTVLQFGKKEIQSTSLSVGFRPSRVFINEGETYAYVVSEPGISVIQLGDDVQILRELFLPDGQQVGARDVVFSKDGALALVRQSGSTEILVIETMTNERVVVQLPSVVTDLDLSGDGTTAVCVVRAGQPIKMGQGGQGGAGGEPLRESVVALLPMESIFNEPEQFETFNTDEIVGSAVVAHDASQVLLYTNAQQNSHLTILSVESGIMRTLDLKAPVQAAFLSGDGAHGVALMAPPLGSTKAGAFALLAVDAELSPRIVGTEQVPQFVSISGEAGRVLVSTRENTEGRATAFFGKFPSLVVDSIELPGRPLAAGMIPDASQAFVAQAHPEGRVTLIDLDTGVEKTVTGFELTSKVVQ